MIAESDIDRAVDFLRTSAQEAAVARAQAKYLTEFLKTKEAQVAERMLETGTSAAEAKLRAKADREYIEILDGYRVAIERDAFFTFKRDAADAMIRAWQTMCSNQRTENRAYG